MRTEEHMDKTMNKVQHILFTRAVVLPTVDRDLTPAGCQYDVRLGAWVTDDSTRRLLIEIPGRRPPGTKKQDLETGEDQKGT
jgi:hypothetical protein